MSTPTKARFNLVNPCPVCETGSKGCSITVDDLHVCRPGPVRADEWKETSRDATWGYYRRVGDNTYRNGPRAEPVAPPRDWFAEAEAHAAEFQQEHAEYLSKALNLPVSAFAAMPLIGFLNHPTEPCWTFPEFTPSGLVCGISRRFMDGSKRTIKDGKRGLSLAANLLESTGPVFIVEGASDVLAMTAAGLAAVGRPSNTGGLDLLAELLRDFPADRPIVVMGENDQKPDGKWPGKDGVDAIAPALARKLGRAILTAYPPEGAKDVRAWLTSPGRDESEWVARGQELSGLLMAKAEPVGSDKKGDVPPKSDATGAEWEAPSPFGRRATPPEFPAGILPPWLERYCVAVAIATQTPADAAAMLALAAVAGGFGGKVRYQVRRGFGKNANLYVVVAMESGERKSAVFKMMFAPIFAAEKKAGIDARPVIAGAVAARATKEAKLQYLQKQAAKTPTVTLGYGSTDDEIRVLAEELALQLVPVEPRFLVDDETLESLSKTLCEQRGRLMQVAAEGTAFEIVGGRYSDKENFDIYLKAHDGDPVRTGRISRGYLGHDNPCLTCGLAVQPSVLQGLGTSANAAGRGFLARWLYAVPEPKVGTRVIRPDPVPWENSTTYASILTRIWEYRNNVEGDILEIAFDSEADDALAEFEQRIEPRLLPGGDLSGLAAWGTKIAGEVARIAGTIYMATIAEQEGEIATSEVPASAVRAAVRLADEYLIPHAVLALGMMNADPVESLAQRVLNWAGRKPETTTVSGRAVQLAVSGGNKVITAKDLEPVFDLLVETGHFRPLANLGKKTGKHFDINPMWERGNMH